MDNQQSVPENSVTPPVQAQVTPDLVSPQGKQDLHNTLATTIFKKKFLDFILKGIADKVGAEFSSRVKNPETVIQKVATKRMAGRDYNLDDVNDAYGGRFIIKKSKDIGEIKEMLKKASELGVFKIDKQEERTQATYHAHHLDIITPDGIKGEIQIMTPQEELEAVANHSLRSVFGEKPPKGVEKLRDMQAALASKIDVNTAHQKAQQIQDIGKQNGDKPLPPNITAQVLKQ
jgi:ppGpp synthetase/RelA/SpoT-type nucleotidyltranferase